MKNWQQRLYNRVPWGVKETLVALEAQRRNRYRRYGNYATARHQHDFTRYAVATPVEIEREQLRALNVLLRTARGYSKLQRDRLPESLGSLDDLTAQVPILSKADVREHRDLMLDPAYNAKNFWRGQTSGSTGTPLGFLVGREGIRARTAIQDNYYEWHGCRYGERRARFGGVKIVPVDAPKPPYWIYNRPDNQLQVSAYHIDPNTLPHYVRKLESFEPQYITGYAHAQYQVAQYLCETGGMRWKPRALFTDSEGSPAEHRALIEEGFGAPCYDVYGLGEVGWVAVECKRHRYHILQFACILEVVDADGEPVPPGQVGRIVVTDLTQSAFPYIRYDTGDAGAVSREVCSCGMRSQVLERVEGRSDDLVVTPRGRRVGRLSHVTKPGRGIRESQIAQTHPDRVLIRVVPTERFDSASMQDVVAVARELLGTDMRVDWEIVQAIPRTNRHKFKHVVRECEVGVPS